MVMAQFDVFRNIDALTCEAYPFFVDVQNDLLSSLKTRVVIPIVPFSYQDSLVPTSLCPRVVIDDQSHMVLTQLIATISLSALEQYECSLFDSRDEIVAAMDCLITGV